MYQISIYLARNTLKLTHTN